MLGAHAHRHQHDVQRLIDHRCDALRQRWGISGRVRLQREGMALHRTNGELEAERSGKRSAVGACGEHHCVAVDGFAAGESDASDGVAGLGLTGVRVTGLRVAGIGVVGFGVAGPGSSILLSTAATNAGTCACDKRGDGGFKAR